MTKQQGTFIVKNLRKQHVYATDIYEQSIDRFMATGFVKLLLKRHLQVHSPVEMEMQSPAVCS